MSCPVCAPNREVMSGTVLPWIRRMAEHVSCPLPAAAPRARGRLMRALMYHGGHNQGSARNLVSAFPLLEQFSPSIEHALVEGEGTMSGLSVTPSSDNQTSRNAEPAETHRRCSCGELVEAARQWSPHCSTCHSGKHYACVQCGRCLPASGIGTLTKFGEPRVRIYRNYCSSACRQKAYRARRRPVKTPLTACSL